MPEEVSAAPKRAPAPSAARASVDMLVMLDKFSEISCDGNVLLSDPGDQIVHATGVTTHPFVVTQ